MAKTLSKKKGASKAGRTASKPKAKRRRSKKAPTFKEKALPPYISDATREQLRKLGDKLNEATDKGAHVAKEVAERVRHFASEATELTKLKIEIYKLKSHRDRLFTEMGEKLADLYKTQQLTDVQSIFADDFKTMEELEANISEKEKQAVSISL